MSFDLTIQDAAWSPNSATICAAVRDDGKVGTPEPSCFKLLVCQCVCFTLACCYLLKHLEQKGLRLLKSNGKHVK